MNPGLDHQSDPLGIRSRQRAAPLALDDFEHIRIAHAAEALDENSFRDRISARRQPSAWARLMIGSLSTSTPSQSKMTSSNRRAILPAARRKNWRPAHLAAFDPP